MAQLPNPLPVGRYWMDLIGPVAIARFVDFCRNPTLGPNVKVVSSEHHDPNTSLIPGTASTPEREWVLFDVVAPVFWDYPFYGTPTPAAATVASEADTIQSPAVEDMSLVPDFRGIGSAVQTGVMVIGGAVLVVGLAIVLSNVLGKKGR